MRRWLRMYAEIRKVALKIRYTGLDRHPTLIAWRIGHHLFADFGWREARASARRYSKQAVKTMTDSLHRSGIEVEDIGFSWYDKNTFFHRRHVSSLTSRRGKERISADRLERMRNALNADISALQIDI